MKYFIFLTLLLFTFCATPDNSPEKANAANNEKSLVDTLKEKAESEEGKKVIQTVKEKAQDKETQEKIKSIFKKKEEK